MAKILLIRFLIVSQTVIFIGLCADTMDEIKEHEIVEENVTPEPDGVLAEEMFRLSYCTYAIEKDAPKSEANKSKEISEPLHAYRACLKENFEQQNTWNVRHAVEQECDGKGNNCAFVVATSLLHNRIAVAFRGTTTLLQLVQQVLGTVKHGCVPFDARDKDPTKGYVNSYLYQAVNGEWKNMPTDNPQSSILSKVRSIIDGLLEMAEVVGTPYDSIIFTGHSLGGALASLSALRLHEHLMEKWRQPNSSSRSPKTIIELYSFGEPRVGCPVFAQYFDQNISHSFRIVHSFDIVSHTPPASNRCIKCNPNQPVAGVSYQHHGKQYSMIYAKKSKKKLKNKSPAEREIILKPREKSKSRKFLHLVRLLDDHHKYYHMNTRNVMSMKRFLNHMEMGLGWKDLWAMIKKCFDSKDGITKDAIEKVAEDVGKSPPQKIELLVNEE